MEQGSLSSECYISLNSQEIASLSSIRNHYNKKQIFRFSIEQTLSLADQAFEAMGRRFRNRINAETIRYGRYCGDLDGASLIISDTLRSYDYSDFFHTTSTDAKETYTLHKKHVNRARKKLDDSFSEISYIIDRMTPAIWHKPSAEKIRESLTSLNEIRSLLNEQLDFIDFNERSHSRAEAFVTGVCMHLVWNAGIKPTKPVTDSGDKTPLLRLLEVFFPIEARFVLSKIYDRDRSLPAEKKIGGTFIKPV